MTANAMALKSAMDAGVDYLRPELLEGAEIYANYKVPSHRLPGTVILPKMVVTPQRFPLGMTLKFSEPDRQ
jgi:hypothetical protein